MNRRSFFNKIVGGVAATAAARTWPFRVFSFPTQIVQPEIIQPVAVKFNNLLRVECSNNRWDMLYGFGILKANRDEIRMFS